MGRVFLTNPVKLDLTPAQQFGKIVVINRHFVYGDEINARYELPAHVQHELEEASRRFEPMNDYLLLAGDHLQVAALAAMLGKRWGRFSVLRYDRIAKGYVQVRVG